MKTFEEALNQATEELKVKYEPTYQIHEPMALAEIVTLAANIYAAEAIKADRQRISQLYLSKATVHDGISFSCPFDVESIHSLPIQF